MIRNDFRMTKLAWLLIGVAALEIGLVISLRRLGWLGTGDLLQMLVSLGVISLPLLVIGIVIYPGATRNPLINSQNPANLPFRFRF